MMFDVEMISALFPQIDTFMGDAIAYLIAGSYNRNLLGTDLTGPILI